jgi:PleD family two-component response regulator
MEKKKLLVIDDSEANLMLFESMFENDPRIEVTLRDNGISIVEYCLNLRPDLILLDLMMPEVNGFEVLEQLQANLELNDIPIVIISALEGQDDIKRAIEMGANDYIIKPVDFEENANMILKLLRLD